MDHTKRTTIMEDDAPDNDDFVYHRRLVDWLTKSNQGFLHPDVRIAHDLTKGFHLVVAKGRSISCKTRIVSCPMSATISVLNALDISPFSNHGTRLPKAFLDSNVASPELVQTVFLMEQYVLGDDSWWSPYIETLPTPNDVNELQFESSEDMAWLEGTNLKGGVATQTAKWQEMYTKALRELKTLGWPNALNDRYSWELFRWAATMFGSRSFTSEVLADTEPADRARMGGSMGIKRIGQVSKLFGERFAVLLPLLDILNHRPVAQVEWQARSTFVGLQVLDTFQAGEELCNNYGPRENEGLLLSYGFSIEGNPFDHVGVNLRIPPGSPVEEARRWEKDNRSHLEYRAFIFGPAHFKATTASCLEASLFSFDLLDVLSMLKANDRELSAMYTNQQTLMSQGLGKPHHFQDFRNMYCVLAQLLQDCCANLKRLQNTQPLSCPSNRRQENAKVYRDSQQRIYETAASLCVFVLRKACMNLPDEELLKDDKMLLPTEVLASLRSLVKQHSCITSQDELLSTEKLLGYLPEEICVQVRETLAEIQGRFKLQPVTKIPRLGMQKMEYALFLSAAYCEYERGIKYPSRLRLWLRQVAAWYPPDDPNWSYVPSPGPWKPGEAPPEALMQLLNASNILLSSSSADSTLKKWLKPKRICWAWNVVEEEGVVVPADVLDRSTLSIERKEQSTFLLYLNSS